MTKKYIIFYSNNNVLVLYIVHLKIFVCVEKTNIGLTKQIITRELFYCLWLLELPYNITKHTMELFFCLWLFIMYSTSKTDFIDL